MAQPETHSLRPYDIEGLTPTSMVTNPKMPNIEDHTAIDHDVTIMNPTQLTRYVLDAFLEKDDQGFLPMQFWHYAFMGTTGMGEGAPGAPNFFARKYSLTGRIFYGYQKEKNPDEVARSWASYPVHLEYRHNLRHVLNSIIAELAATKNPSEDELALAPCVVETVMFIADAEGHGQGYPDDAENQELYRSASRIIDDHLYHKTMKKIEEFNNLHERLMAAIA